MKTRYFLLGFSLIALISTSVLARSSDHFYRTDFKLSVIEEEDPYLGLSYQDSRRATYGQIKQRADIQWNDRWRTYGLLEAFAANQADKVSLDEEYAVSEHENYLYLREAWIDYSGFGRYPGESVRFGIERFRDQSSIWWDKELALLRWNLDTTLLKASLGAGRKTKFNHSDDTFLDEDELEQNWVFGHVDFQWSLHNWLGFKFASTQSSEEDRASINGAIMNPKELTWVGLSSHNEYFEHTEGAWQYYFDLMAVNGEAAALGDVNGWAVDTGMRWNFDLRVPVSIGTQVAFASGGDGSQNTTFYQTGLQTNRSRYAGTRTILSRFGEATKFELSNLQAFSVYFTQSLGETWEWGIVAHDFRRVDVHQTVIMRGVSVSPLQGKKELGQEVDLLIGYFNVNRRTLDHWLDNSAIRLRAGYFKRGLAFDDFPNEGKYRLLLDLQKRF